MKVEQNTVTSTSDASNNISDSAVENNTKEPKKKFWLFKSLSKVKPKAILLICLFIGGLTGIYYIYSCFVEPWSTPKNIRVTNITSRSATISWVTEEKTKGIVIYGETDKFGPEVFAKVGKSIAYDDRDITTARLEAAAKEVQNLENVEGDTVDYSSVDENIVVNQSGKYYVHHVTLHDLTPEKDYYFKIGNGLRFTYYESEDDNHGIFDIAENNHFKTYKEIEDIRTPDPTYGLIFPDNDSAEPVDDAIIYMRLECEDISYSTYLSSTVNKTGGWYIDLANSREKDGTPVTDLDDDLCWEVILVESGEYGTSDVLENPMSLDTPTGDIYITGEDNNNVESSHTKSNVVSGVFASILKSDKSGSTSKKSSTSKSDKSGTTSKKSRIGKPSSISKPKTIKQQEPPPPTGGAHKPKNTKKPTVTVEDNTNKSSSSSDDSSDDSSDGGKKSLASPTQQDEKRCCCNIDKSTCYWLTPLLLSDGTYEQGCESQRSLKTLGSSSDCDNQEICCRFSDTNYSFATEGTCSSTPGASYHMTTDWCDTVCCHIGSNPSTFTSKGTCTEYWDGYTVDNKFCNLPPEDNSEDDDPTICCKYSSDGYSFYSLLKTSSCTSISGVLEPDSSKCGVEEDIPPEEQTGEKVVPPIQSENTEIQEGPDILEAMATGGIAGCVAIGVIGGGIGMVSGGGVGILPGAAIGCVSGGVLGAGGAGLGYGLRGLTDKYIAVPVVPNTTESGPDSLLPVVKVYADETAIETQEEYIIIPQIGKYVASFGDYESAEFVTFQDDVSVFFFEDTNGNLVMDEEEKLVYPEGFSVKVQSTAKIIGYKLKEGFNIVSFPFVIDAGFENNSASELLTYLNQEGDTKVFSIAKLESGKWITVENRNGDSYGADDFQIIPGKGYLIKAIEDIDIVISGKEVVAGVPVYLNAGWNLVGIHGASSSYTAESLIDTIDMAKEFDTDNVTRWDVGLAKYEGLQKEPDSTGTQQVYGFDFPINDKLGYFVRIKEGGGIWTPE